MNKNDFLNMIGDTVQVNRQMVGEISELINIFPYFQSAHMLLLKGMQNNADVKFENQLRSSSIHIADREVLYYLLNPPKKDNEPDIKKDEEPEASFVSEQIDPMRTAEPSVSAEIITPEIVESPIMDRPEFNENGGGADPGKQNNSEIAMEEAGEDVLEDSHEIIESENSDPLESFNNELLELDINPEEEDNRNEITPEEQLSHDAESKTKKLQSDLIDRFIIANPRIEPNRDKTLLPAEDMSKPPFEVEGGFVTETLARIYVNQGYYSKAVDIYEKLSLKFPEKSSYFATQIEKVKEHLKN